MPLADTIKPDPYCAPTQEQIARGRDMYVQGFTVSRCVAASGMSLGTFYYWLDGGPDDGSGPMLPPIPRRRVIIGKRRKPLAATRVSLASRLWRTAERQVRDIEARFARGDQPPADRERDTRMLAVLIKALRDLDAFDSDKAAEESEVPAARGEEPSGDEEQLRRELARKLDNLLAQGNEGTSSS